MRYHNFQTNSHGFWWEIPYVSIISTHFHISMMLFEGKMFQVSMDFMDFTIKYGVTLKPLWTSYFVGREHLPRWVHLTKHSCLLRAMEMGIPRQMPIGLLFLKQHLQIFAASPTISLSPSMGCRPSLQLLFGSPICEEIHRHLWFLWGLPNISILDIE